MSSSGSKDGPIRLPSSPPAETPVDISALLSTDERLANTLNTWIYYLNRFKSVYFFFSSFVLHMTVYLQSVESEWAGWVQPTIASLALPSVGITWALAVFGGVLPGALAEMDARKRATETVGVARPLEVALRRLADKANTEDKIELEQMITKVQDVVASLPLPPSTKQHPFPTFLRLAWTSYTASGVLVEQVRRANFELNLVRVERDALISQHTQMSAAFETLPGIA